MADKRTLKKYIECKKRKNPAPLSTPESSNFYAIQLSQSPFLRTVTAIWIHYFLIGFLSPRPHPPPPFLLQSSQESSNIRTFRSYSRRRSAHPSKANPWSVVYPSLQKRRDSGDMTRTRRHTYIYKRMLAYIRIKKNTCTLFCCCSFLSLCVFLFVCL